MKAETKNKGKLFMATNSMAKSLVAQTANSACYWIFHQPKFPESAKKLSKLQ